MTESKTQNPYVKKIYDILKWFFSVNGAIVTICVLLIAGVLVFFVQDLVQRQRYLELLQLELRSNRYTAQGEVNNVLNKKYITTHVPIFTSVYNAGLQQGYVLTLDTDTEARLYTLYTSYFPSMNNLANSYMNIINQYLNRWLDCENMNIAQALTINNCNSLHDQYLTIQKTYSIYIAELDNDVVKSIDAVKFNPTNERLHPNSITGYILRLIMGGQSLKVQQ